MSDIVKSVICAHAHVDALGFTAIRVEVARAGAVDYLSTTSMIRGSLQLMRSFTNTPTIANTQIMRQT